MLKTLITLLPNIISMHHLIYKDYTNEKTHQKFSVPYTPGKYGITIKLKNRKRQSSLF